MENTKLNGFLLEAIFFDVMLLGRERAARPTLPDVSPQTQVWDRQRGRAVTARFANVARALVAATVLVLLVAFSGHVCHARDRLSGEVQRVKMIGFTVADVDREANFFEKVLQFEKISDFRVVGSEYDRMEGVFNVNMRIVYLKLGEQIVELTQYVSPPTGRPIPVPSYSNDAWFEHMAIVVDDMDAAYKILQENNVQQISANPITIPESNPGAAGIKAIKFRDPEGHNLELIYFPPGKGDPSWQKRAAENCSSAFPIRQ